jgi:putative membrane protein
MKLSTLTLSVFAAGTLTLSSGCTMLDRSTSTAARDGTMQTTQLQLNRVDENFLENAAQSGHAEIEGSRLALTKARSAEVKDFAQQMIQDHSAVNRELMALAQQKGYMPPTEPSVMQQAELKTLNVTDDSFDRLYASRIGVAAHESAVKLFREASFEAVDPDVRAFATKTLPALEQHLEMARSLQQSVSRNQ